MTVDNNEQARIDRREADKRRKRVRITVIVIVCFFIFLFLAGLIPRLMLQPGLKAQAREQEAPPTVQAAKVAQPPAYEDLELPGNVEAVEQTAVVARASGYVKKWMVDIGDTVREGQVLATIESPDLDQQVMQARAQVGASQAAYYQAQANLGNQEATLAQSRANLSHSQAALEQAETQLAQSRASLAQAQQQAAQQQATLTEAQANLHLAEVTARRYKNLLADGAIDRQTTDQMIASYQTNAANVQALRSALAASQANVAAFRAAVGSSQANVKAYAADVQSSQAAVEASADNVRSGQANVQAAQQNIRSNQANLEREVVLQQYENVTAPFAGIITARNVENGALISGGGTPTAGSSDVSSIGNGEAGATSLGNAASGSGVAAGSSSSSSPATAGAATSLFSLAQLGQVRVYINIPQTYIDSVRIGQPATLSVKEVPGQVFQGTVTRSAGALDAASRTLVAEVRINNPRGQLRPGMFADVHLRVNNVGGDVLIPDPAMVTNAQGNQAVLIEPNNTIHFQPITVGRDFGNVIEVTSGLQAGQEIVANPSDSLQEGQTVKVTQPSAPSGGST